MIAESLIARAGRRAIATSGVPEWRLEVLRVCLVPLFVALCYQFEWRAWRALVAGAFLTAAPWFGVPAARLGADSFICHGELYHFAIACTALDAFFGSIPLVWNWRARVAGNLAVLAAYFVCLSAINLARLELGLAIYLRGVPWSLAHEAMAGVFYFALFLWIARRRRWS